MCLTRPDFSVHLKRQPTQSKMGLDESLGEDPNYVKTNHNKIVTKELEEPMIYLTKMWAPVRSYTKEWVTRLLNVHIPI